MVVFKKCVAGIRSYQEYGRSFQQVTSRNMGGGCWQKKLLDLGEIMNKNSGPLNPFTRFLVSFQVRRSIKISVASFAGPCWVSVINHVHCQLALCFEEPFIVANEALERLFVSVACFVAG